MSTSTVKLVTAWRALNFDGELMPIVKGVGTGMVVDWQLPVDQIAVGGNVEVIKLWDINRELPSQDIQTHATAAVTCLSSEKVRFELLFIV